MTHGNFWCGSRPHDPALADRLRPLATIRRTADEPIHGTRASAAAGQCDDTPGNGGRTVHEPAGKGDKAPLIPVPAGTLVKSSHNGGGNFGDPLQRDLAAIEWDRKQGYVSPESAVANYGAVLDSAGRLDANAIAARRASLRLPPTKGDAR